MLSSQLIFAVNTLYLRNDQAKGLVMAWSPSR
jgi:hypothetical protein